MQWQSAHVVIDHEPAATTVANERRRSERVRSLYRVARVDSESGRGMARVRNLSDHGIGLSLGFPVLLGDRVTVSLSDSLHLHGTVIWSDGADCGVRFDAAIDCDAVLGAIAVPAAHNRPPRLETEARAVVSSEHGIRPAQVRDISLRGMKITAGGAFRPGLAVKVTLSTGTERRGVVRWVRDGLAGLMLTEPFGVHELASAQAL